MPKPRSATAPTPAASLAARVSALERALRGAEVAAERATQQLADQQTTLTRLSRELRMPLNSVLGMAAHLGNTPLNSHQRQLVDIIAASGQHGLEVLDHVREPAPPLPLAAAARVPHLPVPAFDTGRLRGVRLLLVEDNPTNREVARLLLQPWGVVIHEAEDGPAALAQLMEQCFDVVLMDIQLPGMSGLDVTRQLRHHPDPRRAGVPVIALTANAFRSDIKTYLAAGLTDCLAKPFEEADLYQKIAAVLPGPAIPA